MELKFKYQKFSPRMKIFGRYTSYRYMKMNVYNDVSESQREMCDREVGILLVIDDRWIAI